MIRKCNDDYIRMLKVLNDMHDGVVVYGAEKHGQGTWLDPDNKSMSTDANLKSILGHVSRGLLLKSVDSESGQDELLHAICRLSYEYYRRHYAEHEDTLVLSSKSVQ